MADTDLLRSLLGERIPEGGSASDTMFTDLEIQEFLDRSTAAEGDINLAAYYGWVSKAAELANLVDTAEGSSKREMGQLHDNALAQIKYYEGLTGVTVSASRRARVGNITRSRD